MGQAIALLVANKFVIVDQTTAWSEHSDATQLRVVAICALSTILHFLWVDPTPMASLPSVNIDYTERFSVHPPPSWAAIGGPWGIES